MGHAKYLQVSDIPAAARPAFDFSKQEVMRGNLCIWHTCTNCHRSKWVIKGNARTATTSLCHACWGIDGPSERREQISWVLNGYRMIHVPSLYPEQADYILEQLVPYTSNYDNRCRLEHRVVALLTYGPQAIAPGTVVRHLDGDKLNNIPENLTWGTRAENHRDHVKATADAMYWKQIAMTLFYYILEHNSSSFEP